MEGQHSILRAPFGAQLGQLLDDADVTHLESISQLQLLLVCRHVFSHSSPFGGYSDCNCAANWFEICDGTGDLTPREPAP